eukprot:scaffold2238_cov396-Prasinococcus_capsulatus_cf.AAC.8
MDGGGDRRAGTTAVGVDVDFFQFGDNLTLLVNLLAEALNLQSQLVSLSSIRIPLSHEGQRTGYLVTGLSPSESIGMFSWLDFGDWNEDLSNKLVALQKLDRIYCHMEHRAVLNTMEGKCSVWPHRTAARLSRSSHRSRSLALNLDILRCATILPAAQIPAATYLDGKASSKHSRFQFCIDSVLYSFLGTGISTRVIRNA